MQYYKPTDLADACRILAEHGEGALPVAGGTFYMGHREELFSDVTAIVNLKHLGLSYMRLEADRLHIGATTTLAEILGSPITASGPFRILAETVHELSIPEVRNAATIGGEVCIAGEVDMPTTLLAYDAEIVVGGAKGGRVVPMHQFHKGYLRNALEPGEIVTEVQLRVPPPKTGGAFRKFERTAADLPLVNATTRVTLDREGVCREVRIVVGAATRGGLPTRVAAAEGALTGRRLDAATIGQAAAAAAATDCVDDFRASAALRSRWIHCAVEDALQAANAQALEAR